MGRRWMVMAPLLSVGFGWLVGFGPIYDLLMLAADDTSYVVERNY